MPKPNFKRAGKFLGASIFMGVGALAFGAGYVALYEAITKKKFDINA